MDGIAQTDDSRARALDWLSLVSECQSDLQRVARHHAADAELRLRLHRCELARQRIEGELASAFASPLFHISPDRLASLEDLACTIGQTTALYMLLVAARQRQLPPCNVVRH